MAPVTIHNVSSQEVNRSARCRNSPTLIAAFLIVIDAITHLSVPQATNSELNLIDYRAKRYRRQQISAPAATGWSWTYTSSSPATADADDASLTVEVTPAGRRAQSRRDQRHDLGTDEVCVTSGIAHYGPEDVLMPVRDRRLRVRKQDRRCCRLRYLTGRDESHAPTYCGPGELTVFGARPIHRSEGGRSTSSGWRSWRISRTTSPALWAATATMPATRVATRWPDGVISMTVIPQHQTTGRIGAGSTKPMGPIKTTNSLDPTWMTTR